MRPSSPRFVTLWITALCLLATFTLDGRASAASNSNSKRKLSTTVAASARMAQRNAPPPPLTADSWTGSGGDSNWGTATNWSGGVPTSTSAVTIGTTTAAVNMNTTGNFGTLTLSNSGDGLTVLNGDVLNAFGNITNNGSLGLSSTGGATELVLQGNVTLNGTGTLTLSNNAQNYIFASNSLDQFNNQQTIQGAGHIGDGQMSLINSGTINANQSAGMTIQVSDGFTNTGTVEATAGATLTLTSDGTIVNTGGTFKANAATIQLTNSQISGGTVTLTGASNLQLSSATICCGTMTNSSTGTIEIVSGQNILGGTINNSAGGLLKVDNGADLYLQPGTYSQLGTVQLNSSGSFTALLLAGNVTLSGGSLTLSNNPNNYIYGQVGTDTLTNNETISGAGIIGNGQMTLVNSGTINSNQSSGMTINANFGVTNTGTIEATSGSTLTITNTGVNNTGGTIAANTGAIQLNSSTVRGGTITLTGASTLLLNTSTIHLGDTITNSSAGTIEIGSGTSTLGGTINNSAGGTFKIDNGAVLNLNGGTYSQLGAVQLNSSGSFAELVLEGDVTLSGGSLTLSNNANNYIFGQVGTDTLTNNETISGAGHIGNGQMALVNSGTINSNQSSGITIDANFGVTNTGTIETTSGSSLVITSTGVNNTGGTIAANPGTIQLNSSTVSGGTITLTGASNLQLNTSTINGGDTITNSSAGTIEIASGTNTLGGTINNSAGGTFKIDNGAVLNLDGGTYSQLGTMQMNSSGNFTELVLEGDVTLSGGSLTLSNNANNYIFGQVGTDTLTNNETISGAGHIGNGQMALVNSGTINSNQSSGITIDANFGVTNTGTIETTSGSSLVITSTGVNNTGGTIAANPGTIQLNSSTVSGGTITLTGASNLQLNTSTIHGGDTITNSSAGTIEIASGTSTLGGTINNSAGGTFKIDNGAVLNLNGGTYSQLGTMQMNSSGNFTELVLEGDVTLSGGSLTLSNNANNYIFGQVGTDTLTNNETISGAGHIGNGQMALVNSGTINSNQSSGITIDANFGVTNTGTIETTSGSSLVITSTGVNNTGGTIAANTGTIQLNSSTVSGGTITLTGASNLQLNTSTIHLGTITNSSAGTIEIASGTSTLGGTINNSAGGTFKIDNGAFLNLDGGTYSQLGTMQMNSSGNFTELTLEGNTTLSGETLTMSGNANNYILAANTFDVLTNSGTIQGAGNIGNGGMGLVNSGTIIANATGNLLINVSSQNFSNTGTIEAVGATLTIEGPGVTFLTNDNQSTATLTGGTYIANGSNIEWNAGTNNITTLAAKVTEEGGGELFNTCTATGCNSNMLAGLTSITSAGALTIGGLAFTDAGAFSNAGSLTILGGESFTVGSLNQISGASLTAGTYVLDANLNLSGTPQTITTNAATLTLAGGTIENTSNSTNALAGLATNTGKLTIGGGSNNVSTTASSFSNTGTLTINSGDSFTATTLTQLSGANNNKTLTAGTYVLAGNLDLTTSGLTITKNSATLTLQGGTINSNGVNALSALASSTKSLTLANSANLTTATSGNFSNSGTVTVNTGSTLAVGGTNSYSQTAGTTTVDGTLTGTSITATGGTVQGAGTLKGNTSIGNATGTAVTMNVGDSGKSGLLAITGTYTQLATGKLTGLINGTTAGTGFSQVNISGSASLGGTINFTVAAAFQASLTLGETFTVLNASAVTGTFTNSTIAINSSFHFAVSYTGTSVVLTVASGPVGASSSSSASTTAIASAKQATITAHTGSKAPIAVSGLHAVSGAIKAGGVVVASWGKPVQGSGAIVARRSDLIGEARIWEPTPMVSSSPVRPTTAAAPSRPLAVVSARATVPTSTSYLRTGQNQSIGVQSQRTPWNAAVQNRPVPVKTMSPLLPRIGR